MESSHENWVSVFCKLHHRQCSDSVPFSSWSVNVSRIPGPKNDHQLGVSIAFPFIVFRPRVMSLNIDMKMIRPCVIRHHASTVSHLGSPVMSRDPRTTISDVHTTSMSSRKAKTLSLPETFLDCICNCEANNIGTPPPLWNVFGDSIFPQTCGWETETPHIGEDLVPDCTWR